MGWGGGVAGRDAGAGILSRGTRACDFVTNTDRHEVRDRGERYGGGR